jgi:hypothetical protein
VLVVLAGLGLRDAPLGRDLAPVSAGRALADEPVVAIHLAIQWEKELRGVEPPSRAQEKRGRKKRKKKKKKKRELMRAEGKRSSSG